MFRKLTHGKRFSKSDPLIHKKCASLLMPQMSTQGPKYGFSIRELRVVFGKLRI